MSSPPHCTSNHPELESLKSCRDGAVFATSGSVRIALLLSDPSILLALAAASRSARKASIIVAISATGTLSAYKLLKYRASSWVRPEGGDSDTLGIANNVEAERGGFRSDCGILESGWRGRNSVVGCSGLGTHPRAFGDGAGNAVDIGGFDAGIKKWLG